MKVVCLYAHLIFLEDKMYFSKLMFFNILLTANIKNYFIYLLFRLQHSEFLYKKTNIVSIELYILWH